MLPNLQVSVYRALTTFETEISPWMQPSEWVDANTKHIHSIFHGIVNLTENADIKAIRCPATVIFQVCHFNQVLRIGSFTHRPSAVNGIYYCTQHTLL